jgi:hypothetical protein
LDPVVDGPGLDGAIPFDQPRGRVGIAQGIAQIPAHGEGDEVVWEPIAGHPPGQGGASTGRAASSARPAPIELALLPIPSRRGAVLTPASITLHLYPCCHYRGTVYFTSAQPNETGLWFPIAVALMTFVVGMFLLKETKHVSFFHGAEQQEAEGHSALDETQTTQTG